MTPWCSLWAGEDSSRVSPGLLVLAGSLINISTSWSDRQVAVPVYSISDSRTRNRLLKYTPEHMHCFATFYGPLVAPNTGFVCFQHLGSSGPEFRVAATGTVLSVDESTEIVKKLKLVSATCHDGVRRALTVANRPALLKRCSRIRPSSRECSTRPWRWPSSRALRSGPCRASAARSSTRSPNRRGKQVLHQAHFGVRRLADRRAGTFGPPSPTASCSATSSFCGRGIPSSRANSTIRPRT